MHAYILEVYIKTLLLSVTETQLSEIKNNEGPEVVHDRWSASACEDITN